MPDDKLLCVLLSDCVMVHFKLLVLTILKIRTLAQPLEGHRCQRLIELQGTEICLPVDTQGCVGLGMLYCQGLHFQKLCNCVA